MVEIRTEFKNGTLHIYSGAVMIIEQPFNPVNGDAWNSEEEAMSWLTGPSGPTYLDEPVIQQG